MIDFGIISFLFPNCSQPLVYYDVISFRNLSTGWCAHVIGDLTVTGFVVQLSLILLRLNWFHRDRADVSSCVFGSCVCSQYPTSLNITTCSNLLSAFLLSPVGITSEKIIDFHVDSLHRFLLSSFILCLFSVWGCLCLLSFLHFICRCINLLFIYSKSPWASTYLNVVNMTSGSCTGLSRESTSMCFKVLYKELF